MPIAMTNAGTKTYLVKNTGLALFGDDFDHRRDVMTPAEAQQRFDQAWTRTIEPVVAMADRCEVSLVREHVRGNAAGFINDRASHVHFKLDGKFFVAQLPSAAECDQLWIVPSAVRDPWTIYVKFAEVPIKERFEKEANRLGWARPEDLAEKLLVDFLESVGQERVERRYLRENPR